MSDAERRQALVAVAQRWVDQPIIAVEAFKTGPAPGGPPIFTPAGLLGYAAVKLFKRGKNGRRRTVLLAVTTDKAHILEANWGSSAGWTVKGQLGSWPRSDLHVTMASPGFGLRFNAPSGELLELEPLWPSVLAAEVSRVLVGCPPRRF